MKPPPRDETRTASDLPPEERRPNEPQGSTASMEVPGAPSTPSAPNANTPFVARYQTLPPGKTLGRYTLRRVIGRGGMGIVYEAWDPAQQRRVALKTLHGAVSDGTSLERFMREARAAARLRHPAIVTVLDVDYDNGRHFFTMEFVPGKSFEERLRAGDAARTLSMRKRVDLVAQVAEGLAHAHHAGVIHRDVKPSNILVTDDGRALLSDFGLAGEMTVADPERITLAGIVLGTPQYVSPEQATGGSRRALPASDIYSLGCVLFRALTGRLPFEGKGSKAIEEAVHGEAPRVKDVNPGIPPALDRIVANCLKKDPRDRYPDGESLARDLRLWLEGRSPDAEVPPARHVAADLTVATGILHSARARVVVVCVLAACLLIVVAMFVRSRLRRTASAVPADSRAAAPAATPVPLADSPTLARDTFPSRNRAELSRRMAPVLTTLDDASAALAKGTPWADLGGELEKARIEARLIAATYPAFPEPALALARLAELEGDFAAAAEFGAAAFRMDPDSFAARSSLAWNLRVLREIAREEEMTQDGRSTNARLQRLERELVEVLSAPVSAEVPSSPSLRAFEAQRRWIRGQAAEAAAAGKLAFEAAPHRSECARALVMTSQVVTRADRIAETTGACDAARGDAFLQAWLGLDYLTGNEAARGLSALDLAIRLAPRFVAAHVGRARCLERLNRQADALVAYGDALRIDPRNPGALALRGRLQVQLGRAPEALADFGESIQADPDRAWAWQSRGEIRLDRREYRDALADFEATARLQPRQAKVLAQISEAKLYLRDLPGALAAAEAAVTMDPFLPRARKARALARFRSADFPGSLEDVEECLKVEPDSLAVLGLRADLHVAMGNDKLALQDLNAMFLRADPDPRDLRLRGSIRRRLGDLPGASEDLVRSLSADPAPPDTWLELALVRRDRGDVPGANEAARQAIGHAPKDWSRKAEAEKIISPK